MSTNSAADRRRALPKISALDGPALRDAFEAAGIAKVHIHTVVRHIVQKRVTAFAEIPGLPRKALSLLEERFCIRTSTVEQINESDDGSTSKVLLRLFDGSKIECVIMRYGAVEFQSFPDHLKVKDDGGSTRFRCKSRATLCVSSQVGCQMGCKFCATGTMGLLGNLTCGEILEQLYTANEVLPIRNVVFMGMGEPLDNYDEVLEAIKAMTDVRQFNLAAHHVCVSTVGVAPRIRQLAKDVKGVCLAVSLHGPNQEARLNLLPSARSWKLQRIMQAIDFFIQHQGQLSQTLQKRQVVLIQYCLIADVNDKEEYADELGILLAPRTQNVMVNVIPYNPSIADPNFRAPSQSQVDKFVEGVRSHNVRVTIRQELGQDIDSACGQLAVQAKEVLPERQMGRSLQVAPGGVLYSLWNWPSYVAAADWECSMRQSSVGGS